MSELQDLREKNTKLERQNVLLWEQNRLLTQILYQGLKGMTAQLEQTFGCGSKKSK
jgi:hypothetical protein